MRKPSLLFDVNADGAANAIDLDWVAKGLLPGNTRYDLNADGQVNTKDWGDFVRYIREPNPVALFDVNGDGAVTGVDLDWVARGYAQGNIRYDLNGDGQVNKSDLLTFLHYARHTKPELLFDVNMDTTMTATDLEWIAGGLYSWNSRFDLNADGAVNAKDWLEVVKYVLLTLRKPEVLFDVDGNGGVTSADVQTAERNIPGTNLRYDFNGDGLVDQADLAAIKNYDLSIAPPAFLGDLNRDGCVNVADYSLVYAARGAKPDSPLWDVDYDLNRDGLVNATDYNLVRYSPYWNKCF